MVTVTLFDKFSWKCCDVCCMQTGDALVTGLCNAMFATVPMENSYDFALTLFDFNTERRIGTSFI